MSPPEISETAVPATAVEWCEGSALSSFRWPQPDSLERRFLDSALRQPSSHWVANVQTDWKLLGHGQTVFPVTVNETDYENSWVASPFNAVITYALEELREVRSRRARWALACLIRSVAPVLKAARINQVVCVNNWLLSTSLYPDWQGDGLQALTDCLLARYPQHVIMFRSLNSATNDGLMQQLRQAGWLLAPSRQVYVCDDPVAALQKQNSQIDHRLLKRKTDYRVVTHAELQDEDDHRIQELYNLLYLQKYSQHNPQFTVALIRLWRQTGLLKMMGLRSPTGRIDGIVGCFGTSRVVTTPLLGYDVHLPQTLGLYRLLTALVFQEARVSGRVLNLSSGAAQFKRHRGGVAAIEYSAVYCRHLPVFRRGVWTLLATLLDQVGARVLRMWEL